MFNYQPLYDTLATTPLKNWVAKLPALVQEGLALESHGLVAQWQTAYQTLPCLTPAGVELKEQVQVGTAAQLDPAGREQLRQTLMAFHPWRKGPFSLYGLHLDTEWRSDWKWARVQPHLSPLTGRVVLDVGSGNGYYGWRMVGQGAKLVVGLDPFLVYVWQYGAIRHLLGEFPNYVLPLGIEHLPAGSQTFDTLFSMGVFYHRRSPFDHLLELQTALRSGGELVLETLVIDGPAGEVLVPEGRYAQMRNVWFIPSTLTLESWLRKAGFRHIRLVDVTPTTTQEQRTTEWMTFHSLANFLDPQNPGRTVEGHPAPIRAVFIAQAP